MLTESCPTCEGSGYIKSRYTMCYEVLRQLRSSAERGGQASSMSISPEVAGLLIEEEKTSLEYLESSYGSQDQYHCQFDASIDSFEVKAVRKLRW